MYTCKVLVKQGVIFATRSRNRDTVNSSSETSTSAIAAPVLPRGFSVRAFAKSFRARQNAAAGWAPLRCYALENANAGASSSNATFDVSSNCVTPVFRVTPFVQRASVPKLFILLVLELPSKPDGHDFLCHLTTLNVHGLTSLSSCRTWIIPRFACCF